MMKREYCTKSHGTRSHHRRKHFTTRHNKQNQTFNHQHNVINNDNEESNLNRFWRECRERDIKKRRHRISNQFRTNDNNFTATINQLKLDAQILSNKFQRVNAKSNKHQNKENRRHSQISSNAQRRQSNIYIPSSNIKSQNQKIKQSENAKIFFENKKYYSSLHNKYNLNSTKSNIQCIYNYFDSLKNDENRLKNKIQQKWHELKKDVNKLNYFHKKKVKESSNQQIYCKKTEKQSVTNTHCDYLTKTKQINDHHRQIKSNKKPKNIITNDQKDQEHYQSITISQLPSEITENIENKHSSTYCLSNLQKSNEYWDYSVRELKDKLLSMNISTDTCVEKKDLVQKIKACNANEGDIKQAPKPAVFYGDHRKTQRVQRHSMSTIYSNKNKPSILYDTILHDARESKQQIINRVDLWIHRWSYRRSFRQLLNSVLGYKQTDKRYISRVKEDTQNYEQVMKLYKKTILLIHPDKHVNSTFEVKYKSGEMLKVITAKCDKYRQKHKG